MQRSNYNNQAVCRAVWLLAAVCKTASFGSQLCQIRIWINFRRLQENNYTPLEDFPCTISLTSLNWNIVFVDEVSLDKQKNNNSVLFLCMLALKIPLYCTKWAFITISVYTCKRKRTPAASHYKGILIIFPSFYSAHLKKNRINERTLWSTGDDNYVPLYIKSPSHDVSRIADQAWSSPSWWWGWCIY